MHIKYRKPNLAENNFETISATEGGYSCKCKHVENHFHLIFRNFKARVLLCLLQWKVGVLFIKGNCCIFTDSSKSSRAKKRTKRSKNEKKLKSLSPLSKRMSAGMGNDTRASDGLFPFGNQSSAMGHSSTGADEYELKV